MQGNVFNIMRYSVADGPGLRTTVFLKGCPLSCAWCHNPESQTSRPQQIFRGDRCLGCEDCVHACPHGALTLAKQTFNYDQAGCLFCGECQEACPANAREIKGRSMSVNQVMDQVLKDLPFYEESGGGVTFSGGEPLMQQDFLAELLKASKAHEIHTALDTSGCVSYEAIEAIAPLTDLFLYDLKTMNRKLHRELVGIDNEGILQNLARLVKDGSRVIVRMPLIPGINDSAHDIEQAGEFLQGLGAGLEVELLPYHSTASEKYRLLGMAGFYPPEPSRTDTQLSALAGLLKNYGLKVNIGGKDDEPACKQAS